MALSLLDWTIIAVYLTGCIAAGVWMKRYVRGVTDFAVAGREMGVYLGIASLAATEFGTVTAMYTAEMGFKNGLAGAAPGVLEFLAFFLVGITGFVIGPLRKANVITLPELFQKRFGSRVRWLAGLVVVLGGVLNMGNFLRLGGEFFVHVGGLDPRHLELTMTVLLAVVLLYTVMGGMVSVLVTDYLQFLIMGLGLLITSVLVLHNVGWSDLIWRLSEVHQASTAANRPGGLVMAEPLNPFVSNGWSWLIWQSMLMLAGAVTWQTSIARVLSAKDSRTAKRVYWGTSFYFVGRFLLPGLWGAAAFVYFWSQGGLPAGIDSRTAMPAYLGTLLPAGVLGIVVAAMLAAEMSTDSGYLLTWSTVIYNDLINPCLRRPLSDRARLLVVRALVVALGLFLMAYGLWYKLPGKAWDYISVTATIYLSSIFTLLIGALYWPKANRWGAYAAMLLGAAAPVAFLVINIDGKERIAPEAAGLTAFALAFAGMFFGSLAGRAWGAAGNTVTLETEP
jgi:SSS family solute:Na+ symporter